MNKTHNIHLIQALFIYVCTAVSTSISHYIFCNKIIIYDGPGTKIILEARAATSDYFYILLKPVFF